jgi:AraC family transcriptional regulator
MSQGSFVQGCAGPALMGAPAYANALRVAGGSLVGERIRDSERSAVSVALYASPAYDLLAPALSVSRLSITLTQARVAGCLDGDRWQAFQSPRYALFLAPAGVGAHWRKESPSRHISLYFHADALADSDPCKHGLGPDGEPLLNVCMPGIRTLTDELLTELESGPSWSAEAADSLGRLLLIKIARHRTRDRAGGNPLTPALLKRVADYVQANLSERILVGDLATVVDLSPNRFALAFTACTGQSPHQFVMEQRLRQAQAFLQCGSAPLAQVAADCGFASQQHLTQVMRRRIGTTPARYRNADEAGAHPAKQSTEPSTCDMSTQRAAA